MSIILRANELNTILYKYLLEAGLAHTAFTLFNEASLAQPLQEFRFDVRSGHLLSLLEKALVYAQIEAHVSLVSYLLSQSEYVQCNQPFHLLKSHTCNVVERVKKQKEQLLRELGDQINDSIKRTNSAYNTAIANRDYDDIVYESKGTKYLEKFAKIRIPTNESDKPQSYIIKGTDQAPLLHNTEDYEIDLLRYDALNDEVIVDQIFPCVSDGKFEQPIDFLCAGDHMVQLYRKNRITVFKLRNDNLEPIQFMLEGAEEATKLLPNSQLTQLVAITGSKEFWILNLQTLKLILHEPGIFSWKQYDEYLVINSNSIKMQSLCSSEQLLSYSTQHEWQQIIYNSQRSLYALISYTHKSIHIHTFENNEPLFIFDLAQQKRLKQIMWINSNSVDYICWLTDTQIKIFDISLNCYSRVIEISQFDIMVTKMSTLQKTDRDECFLIALGADNIIVYDVTNAKIERIELSGKSAELFTLSNSKLALIMENCIYFLVCQYIEPLFK